MLFKSICVNKLSNCFAASFKAAGSCALASCFKDVSACGSAKNVTGAVMSAPSCMADSGQRTVQTHAARLPPLPYGEREHCLSLRKEHRSLYETFSFTVRCPLSAIH